MRTFAELEALWAGHTPPRDRGVVELIVVRPKSGERKVLEQAELSAERGVHGDRWSLGENPNPKSQISLTNVRLAELIADGVPLELFGDNLLVDLDISEAALPAGTRLRAGEVLLEVTDLPHTGCKKYRERFGAQALRWINSRLHRTRRLRGVYCRVIEAGAIRAGDSIVKV